MLSNREPCDAQEPVSLSQIWQDIVAECTQLKYLSTGVLGCRFLYSPQETFSKNNGLLIAGMNPGKESDMSDRAYTRRTRNAYLWEPWAGSDDYQKRVRDFARRLAKNLGRNDWQAFFDETVTATFLPFRSEDDQKLGAARQPAKAFAHSMWSRLLPQLGIHTIIAFGSPAKDGFRRVLSEIDDSQRPALLALQHSRCGLTTDDEVAKAASLFRRAAPKTDHDNGAATEPNKLI